VLGTRAVREALSPWPVTVGEGVSAGGVTVTPIPSRHIGAVYRTLEHSSLLIEGSRRLLAAAAAGPRHDKRLFTAIAAETGAAGNSTALVGTPEQVADALLDYHDLGVRTFLIRGFDPLEDALQYGRALLPAFRDALGRRGAAEAA